MTTMASQITSLTVVYSIVYSGVDKRKHQRSASLAFVRGIHRDRWIPRTKGQLRGKCFHLMTSSWTSTALGESMMTSWYGNTFRITGPLSSHSWIHSFIRGPMMWSFNMALMLAWTSCWTNCRVTGDLSRKLRPRYVTAIHTKLRIHKEPQSTANIAARKQNTIQLRAYFTPYTVFMKSVK